MAPANPQRYRDQGPEKTNAVVIEPPSQPARAGNGDESSRSVFGAEPYYKPMLLAACGFAALSALLALGFHRKYRERLEHDALSVARYHRIADYYGRPIPLSFEYRAGEACPETVETDVDEIYHYGRDYFLKGRSPDGRRSQVYKWSRIGNPRVRFDGRKVDSVEQLFQGAPGANSGARAAA